MNFNLEHEYETMRKTPSDINEHLPVLKEYGARCEHITEFGTRTGVSSVAFLYSFPVRFVCYDNISRPEITVKLQELASANNIDFQMRTEDVRKARIEETDLLFIDTWHVYEQLKCELGRHSRQVRRYIIMHDTTTFGIRGESEGHEGLWRAIIEFLRDGHDWCLDRQISANNGLTVLRRRAWDS